MAAVYLDCNATTPLEPEVQELLIRHFRERVGNAGSRTHEFGQQAKKAVETAREQVASVVNVQPDEVIFTSGATESNNIALLGLAAHGERTGRRHIVSTAIEHKAVLEPLEALETRGFEVTRVQPNRDGLVPSDQILGSLRSDTLAVSVMHVNNETGVHQPIDEIARGLREHEAYFHVDAAQGFGKVLGDLRSPRIDLISVSSHKIYGPVGVGALIARKRGYHRPPLTPLTHGGGQERGLRPGTLPVPLIAALGLASEIAVRDVESRSARCLQIRNEALNALRPLGVEINGDAGQTLAHVLNFSVPGVDSEAIMVALKGIAAVSNGSACTSQSYSPSHVLTAMGLSAEEVQGAIRVSWSHITDNVDWQSIAQRIAALQ